MNNSVKVGDIFQSTSIYYSNRTTFVMVVGFSKSGKTAIVQRTGLVQVDGDWMNGNVTSDRKVYGETSKMKIVPHPWSGEQYEGKLALRGKAPQSCDVQTFYPWEGENIWNNCD